jgi:hypothetical protein
MHPQAERLSYQLRCCDTAAATLLLLLVSKPHLSLLIAWPPAGLPPSQAQEPNALLPAIAAAAAVGAAA